MLANGNVMSDLHEVIDLRAAFNHRAPEGGAIDRDIGSQFHIVFDTDNTQLGNLVMPPFVLHVPKAVAPDDGSAMNDHPGADEAPFPHRHIRIEHAVVADRGIVSDKDAGVECDSGADAGAIAQRDEWPMDNSRPISTDWPSAIWLEMPRDWKGGTKKVAVIRAKT